MDVIDCIPFGRKKAVSRYHLSMMTGMPDRAVRKEIERLRKAGVCILNHQDGIGYYRPDDAEDKPLVEQYIRQEESRARNIYRNLRGAREFIKKSG